MSGKNVWVYVEYAEGKIKNNSLELLHKGKSLATEMNQQLVAVVIGNEVEGIASKAAACGADEVILVEGQEYKGYSTDAYTNAMASLIGKYNPAVILLGSTNNAKDLAARVACRVKTGLVSDCSAIEMDSGSKAITWIRPVLSGRALGKVVCRTSPQMATVKQGLFDRAKEGSATGTIIREAIQTSTDAIRTKLIDFKKTEVTGIKLEDAEVVVAAGAGIGNAENVAIVQALADSLGAAIGSTRALVDSEWLPANTQVGQSGKNVSPQLYIGCGVAGAIQHLSGISSSKCIVAINTDPEAPIFDVADYCVVGDCLEVVPALTEEIKKHKAE